MTLAQTLSPQQPVESLAAPPGDCLIVDADAAARTGLARALTAQGQQVCQAASGQAALEYLASQTFAVLVLDPHYLDVPESQLLQRARELNRDLMPIIVTAHPTIDSTIAAIRANVFDYMLKPCAESDVVRAVERALQARTRQARQERLLAQVRKVMAELDLPADHQPETPSVPAASQVWVHLDRERRVVTLRTNPPQAVELTEGEAALLSALMDSPDRVLTCAQLAQTALGYNGMDKWTVESVIRSSIFRLRQKLEPSPDAPKLIHTVRGRGYYFSSS